MIVQFKEDNTKKINKWRTQNEVLQQEYLTSYSRHILPTKKGRNGLLHYIARSPSHYHLHPT